MSKKHNTKVPSFGSAPKQVGKKNAIAPAQPAKPAPSALTMKPRATSSKSGHRGK